MDIFKKPKYARKYKSMYNQLVIININISLLLYISFKNFLKFSIKILGALILEHVSEIMADTYNVNTRQKKIIK